MCRFILDSRATDFEPILNSNISLRCLNQGLQFGIAFTIPKLVFIRSQANGIS
jgi:hypothetical protein